MRIGLSMLAALLVWTLSSAPAAADEEAPALGSTFIVGDSTTWRMTGQFDDTANWFTRRTASRQWHVDGVGGRTAPSLDNRIRAYLSEVDSAPRTFIMALGTNPGRPGAWYRKDYERSLALLPAETRVVAVTPVRMRNTTARQRQLRWQVARHADWIREVVADRPDSAIAPWEELVISASPTFRNRLLRDGVHQRHTFGRATWLDMVIRAVRGAR